MSPLKYGFSFEIIYNPYVLHNITNFHVFNDDQQIQDFMKKIDVLKDAAIDEDEHNKALQGLSEEKIRKPHAQRWGIIREVV